MSILRPSAVAALGHDGRSFCRTPSCSALYFASDGSAADKEDALVRIGLKESDGARPLCYCFGFTYADVAQEVALRGASSIPARITAEVRAGRCDCAQRNPSGSCCLGEVNGAIKRARSARSHSDE